MNAATVGGFRVMAASSLLAIPVYLHDGSYTVEVRDCHVMFFTSSMSTPVARQPMSKRINVHVLNMPKTSSASSRILGAYAGGPLGVTAVDMLCNVQSWPETCL